METLYEFVRADGSEQTALNERGGELAEGFATDRCPGNQCKACKRGELGAAGCTRMSESEAEFDNALAAESDDAAFARQMARARERDEKTQRGEFAPERDDPMDPAEFNRRILSR